jgi:hypothetical protein
MEHMKLSSTNSIEHFSGNADEFPKWRMMRVLPHIAKNQATAILGLPDDDAAYQIQADPDPIRYRTMDVLGGAHFQCVECIAHPVLNGEFIHRERDMSEGGKSKQRLAQQDTAIGIALREATAGGRAEFLTVHMQDFGLGSRILRRMDRWYADASIRAWDKYQEKFDSIVINQELDHLAQIEQWMNDVMTVHGDMMMLAQASPVQLANLLQNDKQIVRRLVRMAPAR